MCFSGRYNSLFCSADKCIIGQHDKKQKLDETFFFYSLNNLEKDLSTTLSSNAFPKIFVSIKF